MFTSGKNNVFFSSLSVEISTKSFEEISSLFSNSVDNPDALRASAYDKVG